MPGGLLLSGELEASEGGGRGYRLPRHYNVISADGHLEGPPEFYTKYLPTKYQNNDLRPYTFTRPDGVEVVKLGEAESQAAIVHRGPLDDDQHVPGGVTNFRNPDGTYRPGLGDSRQRLIEQGNDSIDAEFLYAGSSTMLRKNLLPKNPDAYTANVQGYNDWLAKGYSAAAPDRLLGGALVPATGVEDAIRELTRARKMGLTWVQC